MKISLNKDITASIDVDAQQGFTEVCGNELPVPGGTQIVGPLNEQAKLARLRIGTKDAHCRNAAHIATDEAPQFTPVPGFPFTDIKWNAHCIMGTAGAEAIPGLPHWSEYDYFVWKGIEPDTHPYSAVYHTPRNPADTRTRDNDGRLSTGLVEYLRQNKIQNVVVGGLATDYCIKETALDLRANGFEVVVNLAACRGIDDATVYFAIKEFNASGILVINSHDDVL